MADPRPMTEAQLQALDREYLTRDEFAALPAGERHAVWQAAGDGLVEYLEPSNGSPRRYNRKQVKALLAGTRPA